MKKKTVENKQSFPGGVFINCEGMFFFFWCCFFSLTFVFQSESCCRNANIREKVEVQLVGGAVKKCWNGGALGTRLIVEFSNCFYCIGQL